MPSSRLELLQDFIDHYNINLLNLIFAGFTGVIVVFGSLITFIEARLPDSIRQSFRYGKHSHKGPADPLVSRLEVPKSWFKHFYIFAFGWSWLAMFLISKCLLQQKQAPEPVLAFLDFVAGGSSNRRVQVDSTLALIATTLMTLQTTRRFYETNFVQIFSKKSKINLSHYLVGHLHYIGAILALLSNTDGFVRGTSPAPVSFQKLTVLHYFCMLVFNYSWAHQYKSNMVLVNLRKSPYSGKVVTERHLLPRGEFFELLSSPHMFFEIVMYVTLLGLMADSTTWRLVTLWVLSNQVMNALLTHQWYKQKFKNYPEHRRAIIPFIL